MPLKLVSSLWDGVNFEVYDFEIGVDPCLGNDQPSQIFVIIWK